MFGKGLISVMCDLGWGFLILDDGMCQPNLISQTSVLDYCMRLDKSRKSCGLVSGSTSAVRSLELKLNS